MTACFFSHENIDHLKRFELHLKTRLEESTVKVQLNILLKFARNIKQEFTKITKTDIDNYFANMKPTKGQNKELSPHTVHHEMLTIQ